MWRDWSVLAVVPARGGSKGIPRKNLRHVAGRSLVAHAAGIVRALSWLDCAVLSTDDEEIAAEAEANGLAAPFRRPAELASDTANSVGMWQHAWQAAEAWAGRRFDISILLEPTSPLRRAEDVEQALQALAGEGVASVMTVSRNPAHFTPEKTLLIGEGAVVRSYLGQDTPRRQDIPAYYHRNGVCYAIRRDEFFSQGKILAEPCVAVVIDRPLVNIDDELELRLADMLLTGQAERGAGA
jgi:CMP-N,N'-diacetyllegionaminic acid synthase